MCTVLCAFPTTTKITTNFRIKINSVFQEKFYFFSSYMLDNIKNVMIDGWCLVYLYEREYVVEPTKRRGELN